MRSFQSRIPGFISLLLVMTSDDLRAKSRSLNAAAALHDGSGMWILQFSTPSAAKAAADTPRSRENDNEPEDEDSHGAHVAATILDCVGDAPVDILPVRVVAEGGGSSSSQLSQGIRYAADRHAKVINISLGGALEEVLRTATGSGVWRDEYTGYGFLDMAKSSVPEYRPAKVFENVLIKNTSYPEPNQIFR